MRVWLRDAQVQECADISDDVTRFIRSTYTQARTRLGLTDPTYDLSNRQRKEPI